MIAGAKETRWNFGSQLNTLINLNQSHVPTPENGTLWFTNMNQEASIWLCAV